MLAPVFKYLLCQNEAAARLLSLRLKENLTMRTVVILDNINPHKEQLTRASLGKTGTPAFDAVEFDKSIDKLELYLRDALRGKVICDNLASAYQLLKQNIRGVREIYTLEGEVLGVDGMVETSGSHDTSKKYRYLNNLANQARIQEEMTELQKKIHRLTVEVEPLRKGTSDEIRRNNSEIDKLQARKEELTMKLQLLETALKNKGNAKPPKELEK
jgi:chromosome segregation ATPase